MEETPFSLWTIQGLKPPLPDSVAEKRWIAESKATPHKAEDAAPG